MINSMKHKTNRGALALVPLLSLLLLSGCTHMTAPPNEPFTAYVGQGKIHLKVGINSTDELRAAKWERHNMGDTWVMPVGNSMATNAGVLARHLFDEVVDMNNSQVPANQTVAAVLTPKVVYFNQTLGVSAFGESIVDIKVEWTLSDLTGNTIWVDTINGQSSGPTGNAFTMAGNSKNHLQKALEDLLLKSEHAISSAPAIKQFAQKQSL